LKKLLGEEALKLLDNPLEGALLGRVVHKGDTWQAVTRQDLGPIGQYLTSYQYTYQGPARGLDQIRVKTTLKYSVPRDAATAGLPYTILKADLKSRDGSGVVLFDRVRGRIAQATLEMTIRGTLLINIGGMNTAVELSQTQSTTMKTSDINPLR
jgi:hypothetical protein